jgi:hypothetical protein
MYPTKKQWGLKLKKYFKAVHLFFFTTLLFLYLAVIQLKQLCSLQDCIVLSCSSAPFPVSLYSLSSSTQSECATPLESHA